MKKLNTPSFAVFFAGCYLGAGFVSGNELTQFFGNFGLLGFLGLLIVFLGFFGVGAAATAFAADSGVIEVDRLTAGDRLRPLRACISGVQVGLMLAILMIVTAGVGALLNTLFSLPTWLGSLLFSIMIACLVMGGISGIVRFLSFSVPLLLLTVVVLAVCLTPRWISEGLPTPTSVAANPLLPNFAIAALTYISFNMGGNIAVVVAAAPNVKRNRVIPGACLGAFLLCFVAICILIPLSLFPKAMTTELPMLTAAVTISPVLGYGYGLLLLLAMTGSGVSKCFGITHHFSCKSKTVKRHPRLFELLLIAVAYPCSLVGFGDLVGTVYPIFGYLSFFLVIGLCLRAFLFARRKKAG